MDIYNLPLEQRVLGPLLAERARTEGDRVYLVFGEHEFTFAETDRRTRALGRGLLARGVQKQEPVAMLMANGTDFVFAWYACCVIGAVMVPINTEYKGQMLDYMLTDSGTRCLIVDRKLFAALGTAKPELLERLDWVAVAGGLDGLELPEGPRQYLDLADLFVAEGDDPEVPCTFRDIQSIMYTSGTTGPSKGVVMPNGHFFASTLTFMKALGLNRDDILFTPLPLFHGLASRLGVLPALLVGARVVIADRFSATQFWRQVTEAGATVAHTIFTIPPVLKGQAPGPYDRAHRLRAMYNSHHDPEFEERFGVRIVEAFGQTETGLTIYSPWPERQQGSCGKVHEDWEAEIVDEFDRPVPPGQTGEIILRPKVPFIMMQGYLNKPQATLDTFRNLWWHTGDIAYRDEEGYFYFADRKKERIRRRGENISSWDVENIVTAHPDVIECAALPHPAEASEDDVRVILVPRPGSGLTPVSLMDWLQSRMPYFMMPRYLEFVPALPRTPSNKVEKYKLVQQGIGPDAWDREKAGYKLQRNLEPKKGVTV